jgi:hypothetical protein
VPEIVLNKLNLINFMVVYRVYNPFQTKPAGQVTKQLRSPDLEKIRGIYSCIFQWVSSANQTWLAGKPLQMENYKVVPTNGGFSIATFWQTGGSVWQTRKLFAPPIYSQPVYHQGGPHPSFNLWPRHRSEIPRRIQSNVELLPSGYD